MTDRQNADTNQTCWRFQCNDPATTSVAGTRGPLPTCADCAQDLVENGRRWQYAE